MIDNNSKSKRDAISCPYESRLSFLYQEDCYRPKQVKSNIIGCK